MGSFVAKKNSTARSIRSTLTSSNSADDLSTASTVAFYMRAVGSTTNKVNGAAGVIVSATTTQAVVRYDWQAADVNTAGNYQAYWLVTFSGGKTDRFPSDGFDTVVIEESFE